MKTIQFGTSERIGDQRPGTHRRHVARPSVEHLPRDAGRFGADAPGVVIPSQLLQRRDLPR
jgi:hypothetical protein